MELSKMIRYMETQGAVKQAFLLKCVVVFYVTCEGPLSTLRRHCCQLKVLLCPAKQSWHCTLPAIRCCPCLIAWLLWLLWGVCLVPGQLLQEVDASLQPLQLPFGEQSWSHVRSTSRVLLCLVAELSSCLCFKNFQDILLFEAESKLAGSHPAFEVRTFITFPSSRICSARHAVLNWPSFSIFWSRSSSFCGAALVNRKTRVTRHSTFCKSCVNPRLMLVDKVEILPSSFPASSVTLSKLLSRFSSTAGSGFLSPCFVSCLLVAAVCRSLHIALFLQALVNKCLKRVLTLWQALCMAIDGLGSSQMIWTAESLADLNIPLRVNY